MPVHEASERRDGSVSMEVSPYPAHDMILTSQPDSEIASDDSVGRILVIETQEERTIAREALRVVQELERHA